MPGPRHDDVPSSTPTYACSFCGKNQAKVQQLIAGDGVCVCDECVDLCVQIMVASGHLDVSQHIRDFNPEAFLEQWISEIDLQDTERVAAAQALLDRLLHRLAFPATTGNQEP